jgi:hypothetical protein
VTRPNASSFDFDVEAENSGFVQKRARGSWSAPAGVG